MLFAKGDEEQWAAAKLGLKRDLFWAKTTNQSRSELVIMRTECVCRIFPDCVSLSPNGRFKLLVTRSIHLEDNIGKYAKNVLSHIRRIHE